MSAPCPFCGWADAEPRQDHVTYRWEMRCRECGASGPPSETSYGAAQLWDRRDREEEGGDHR